VEDFVAHGAGSALDRALPMAMVLPRRYAALRAYVELHACLRSERALRVAGLVRGTIANEAVYDRLEAAAAG
jgi:hypothetical protein